MEFKKHNTKTHIKKKKKTINLNHNYKKEQKSRESSHSFLWGKYGLNRRNDIKFIQNQMERRRVKYKKMKMMNEV